LGRTIARSAVAWANLALRAGNLRYRVLIPAAHRAGVPWARFHTLRHTCAAMLIDAGASPLRLQRWMGHHSAAFTLDAYGPR
jgi:integrase